MGVLFLFGFTCHAQVTVGEGCYSPWAGMLGLLWIVESCSG